MKRSEINARMKSAVEFLRKQNFHLPRWAFWTPDDWSKAGHEADEIRQRQLGWDITDFGSGDYSKQGLLMFTIRNGVLTQKPDNMAKDYCEKLLLVDENQVTPTHFHWAKMEDIINRGSGKLVLELWNADPKTEQRLDTPVQVSIDGIAHRFAAGEKVVLEPGDSITLPPFNYHRFYGQKGCGTVLVGEVSRVNDDVHDNRFLDQLPRFPAIDEDEKPLYLLCTEYPKAK